jgi:hypothetical protein
VQHAFLTDWLNRPMTAAAQSDIASFMTNDAFLPQSLRHP